MHTLIPKLILNYMFFALSLSAFSIPITKVYNQNIIASVSKIVFNDGKYYLLDSRQRKVFVFTTEKVIKVFGKAGQGPGEFEYPASISCDNNFVYILEKHSRKIHVFNKNGKFIKQIKLKINSRQAILVNDFIVIDNSIYVVFDRGNPAVCKFNLNGEMEGQLNKEEENLSTFVHSYCIKYVKATQLFVVFSTFSAEGFAFNKKLQIRRIFGIGLKAITNNIRPILRKEKESLKEKSNNFIEMNVLKNYFPILVINNSIIVMANRKTKEHNFKYVKYDLAAMGGGLSREKTINFNIKDKIIYITLINNKIIAVDEMGNIFNITGVSLWGNF